MDESIVLAQTVGPAPGAHVRLLLNFSFASGSGGGYGSFGQTLHATKAIQLKNPIWKNVFV